MAPRIARIFTYSILVAFGGLKGEALEVRVLSSFHLVGSKNSILWFCPYRAISVSHRFTQGVAIGLNMSMPFQGDF